MFIKAFSDFSVLCNLNWAIKQIPVPEAVPLLKKKKSFLLMFVFLLWDLSFPPPSLPMSMTGHLDNAGSSSLPCASVADLCSIFNQTLTFICVCLLKFVFP